MHYELIDNEIKLVFTVDQPSDIDMMKIIIGFCGTHNIYFVRSREFYNDQLELSIKLYINIKYYNPNNGISRQLEPELKEEVIKLITDIKQNIKYEIIPKKLRFSAIDLDHYAEIYKRLEDEVSDQIIVRPIGIKYDSAMVSEHHIFEITFLKSDDLLVAKLKNVLDDILK